MSDPSENFTGQAADFQKIWLESMSKLMQAACAVKPDSVPPEVLRQIRNGIFQALSESWNEFLRSPQFQQNMKQWMDSAIAFRRLTNDAMAKVRREMQAPSRDDVDAIMLAVRHLETRMLGRLEELAKEIKEQSRRSGPAQTRPAATGHNRPAPKSHRGPNGGHKKGKKP